MRGIDVLCQFRHKAPNQKYVVNPLDCNNLESSTTKKKLILMWNDPSEMSSRSLYLLYIYCEENKLHHGDICKVFVHVMGIDDSSVKK